MDHIHRIYWVNFHASNRRMFYADCGKNAKRAAHRRGGIVRRMTGAQLDTLRA